MPYREMMMYHTWFDMTMHLSGTVNCQHVTSTSQHASKNTRMIAQAMPLGTVRFSKFMQDLRYATISKIMVALLAVVHDARLPYTYTGRIYGKLKNIKNALLLPSFPALSNVHSEACTIAGGLSCRKKVWLKQNLFAIYI